MTRLPSLEEIRAEKRRRRYRADPVAYASERLGVQWWSKQQEIARALLEHPRVLVKASHSVGKSHLAGGLALWWYETRTPSICLTTAPTDTQVKDILWREIRSQAPQGLPLLPKAPRIDDPHNHHHFAAGFTARDATSFQGRHSDSLLAIFDECTGVDTEFWRAADGMLTGPGTRMLAVCNPTDTASEAYAADISGEYHTITVSALDHPNIAAELAGLPAPFPKAVRLSWVEERIRQWCTPIADPTLTDIAWPPASGRYYRPGPLFESRVLGRWPSQSIDSVWSDALLGVAFREGLDPLPEPADVPCEIGCDVARFGDDFTTMHVRRGPVSLHHERHNGWDTARTAGRLKELADEYGRHCGVDGTKILVKIDETGVGGGVVDKKDGYSFVGVNGGSKAYEPDSYPNRRSESWFAVAAMALENRVDFSRLPQETKVTLRRQLMGPKWRQDAQGRRVVEPKADSKRRLKVSPDDADAVNLCYAPGPPEDGMLEYMRRQLAARQAG